MIIISLLLVISSHSLLVSTQDLCKTNDYFAAQLQCYKENNPKSNMKLTFTNGAPLQQRYTTAINGDLMKNPFFLDSVLHVLTEKIPERSAHPSGIGVYGYFQVTHPFNDVCKAKLFNKRGKKTPVVVRFSNAFTAKGSPETVRDIRGFAVRFDTEEGLFSIPSVNVPAFVFKDPNKFLAFSHGAVGVNPTTNAIDQNAVWDYILANQESFFSGIFLFTEIVTPNGYDRMNGFSIHTYQLENEEGKTHFARFHWIPELGVNNLNSTQAAMLAGTDPFYLSRKLFNQIKAGNFPKWSLYAQVLSENDVDVAKQKGLDVFDVTRPLFIEDYPLRKIGTLVTNRTVSNHFAETEQLAFCPSDLIPGILGAPDAIFVTRKLAYKVGQKYRLGSNFYNSEVNKPKNSRVVTYNRNGVLPVGDNGGDGPNYYPNSFNGPSVSNNIDKTTLIQITQDGNPTNFGDAKRYYEKLLNSDERSVVSTNMAGSLSVTADEIQERVLTLLKNISPQMYNEVAPKLEAIKAASAVSS